MIIVKRRIFKTFDEVDSKVAFRKMMIDAIGSELLKKSDELDKRLLWNDTIARRKWFLQRDENGVNYCFTVIDAFKRRSAYEKMAQYPINLEVRSKLEAAGFEYEVTIDYFDKIAYDNLEKSFTFV